ncbi:hypothetical protein V8F33_001566 [Rhypophila sp. PSN 637]
MKGLACKKNDGEKRMTNEPPVEPSLPCLTALVPVAGGNLFLGVMHSEYIYSLIQYLVLLSLTSWSAFHRTMEYRRTRLLRRVRGLDHDNHEDIP